MKRKYRINILLLFIITLLWITGCASGNGDNFYDFSNTEPKSIDPWVYFDDTSLSSNTSIRNLAASSTELGITIGVIGIVFSMFYMVIRICFTKNAQQREEIKKEALLKGVIAIMIFSIPFWLGIFKYVSELLI